MSETKKKKKIPWKQIVIIIVLLSVSFCVGLGAGKLLDPILDELPPEKFFTGLLGVYIFLLLFYFVQVVVHEAGHLVFGLLTGYQYSSFRIGSFMWVKSEGKLKLRRYSLAGTGGQCLMAPPDMVDGKVPYVLYNLGGCLANIVVSVIPAIIVLLSWKLTYFNCMVLLWAVIGLVAALLNGIPMKLQGMPNDGHNALSLGKHPEALKAFWLQMKINEQIALGKRMRELPEEWFAMPTKEGLQNSMIATVAVFRCNRLMDRGKYAEADELMEWLLTEKTGMVGIHRNILRADQIFCEIVGENRAERYEKLYTEEQKRFMKAMRKSPSVFRVEYLYAKYVEKDEAKAKKAMDAFERVAKTYPYPHEIEGEWEMIAYAEKRYQDRAGETA